MYELFPRLFLVRFPSSACHIELLVNVCMSSMRRCNKSWIRSTQPQKKPPLRRFSWCLRRTTVSFSGASFRYMPQALLDNRRAVPGTPTPPQYVHFKYVENNAPTHPEGRLFYGCCFYGCFFVIEAHGGTWFRTLCPNCRAEPSKVLAAVAY